MIPPRPLVGLVAVVVAVHWWVIDAAPTPVRTGPARADPAPWITRLLSVAPPPLPSSQRVAVSAPARTARAAAARPPTPTPPPKPTAAPVTQAPAQRTDDPPQSAADTASNSAESQVPIGQAATETIAVGNAAGLDDVVSLPRPPASGAMDKAPGGTELAAAADAKEATAEPAPASAPAPVPSALAGAPLHIPQPMRLSYQVRGQVKGLDYNVNAQLAWAHDGERYDARQEISIFLVGSRVQTSRGRMTAQGLTPERFSDKARTEQAAHFDQAQGTVRFSANTPGAALLPGAQDRLSVMIQLAALLGGDPVRYPAGSVVAIQTIGARDADVWAFRVEGEDTLQLASGALRTVHLVRAPRREFDIRVELWMAPTLDYLPARVRLTQANGDFVDLQFTGLGKP